MSMYQRIPRKSINIIYDLVRKGALKMNILQGPALDLIGSIFGWS